MQAINRTSLFAFAVLVAIPATCLPGTAAPATVAQAEAAAASTPQPAAAKTPADLLAPVGAGWG